MGRERPRVRLFASQGPLRGKVFDFDTHDTFLFGRAADCHACLAPEDGSASRHHFLLEVAPPRARLRDLGSLNGTCVNGRLYGGREEGLPPEAGRPSAQVDLRDGDRIEVGDTVFGVSIRGEDPQPLPLPRPAAGKQPFAVPGLEIGRVLGRGGMGVVYLARRQKDGREVAVKAMLPELRVDEHAREVFLREMRVSSSLRHPNIVEVLEHGEIPGGFYMAMELCRGGSASASAARRGGRLSPRTAVGIALEALAGLGCAHDAGYVHRDLKPENLLFAAEGETGTKVADFGLAKAFDSAGLSGMTATGAVAGTLPYMPREQITNYRDVRPVSDVWSLAASLYHLLTGCFPRNYPRGVDPIFVVLRGEVVPIRARDPHVPRPVAEVIDRALAEPASARYQTAHEFREALLAVTHRAS